MGEHSLSANLVVRFQPFFNLSYTSHVTLIQPHLVTAVCKDMNLFDHLHTVWKFSPVENHPENTQVDFVVAFKFKNAFLGRTQHIYGSEKLVKADSPVIQHSTTSLPNESTKRLKWGEEHVLSKTYKIVRTSWK